MVGGFVAGPSDPRDGDLGLDPLHATEPEVVVGGHRGRTVVARHATPSPFVSQIDPYAGPYAHVHAAVRRR